MNKGKLISIFKFLGGINIAKVTNKEVRSAIISNHLMMYRIALEHDEDIKELQKKLFEGKDEEIMALNNLREEYRNAKEEEKKAEILKKVIEEHTPLLQLEAEFSNEIGKKLEEEKEVNLKKVAQADFVDTCVEAGVDITPSDLIALEDLFNDNDNN